jgi:hypothetical protein
MLSMARVVFDNDHPPTDLPGVKRWEGKGWESDSANGFINPGGATATSWLRYSHLLRPPQTGKTLITDFTGYNTFVTDGHRGPPAQNWVGDLLLECEVTLDKPEGQFVMQLSKSHYRFEARWNLATGDCELYKLSAGRDEKIGSAKTMVSGKGRTYKLRFADVDEKLTVWVDNALPFGDDGVSYSTAALNVASGPTVENDLEPASIGIQTGAAKVKKLKLLRDTYYTNDPRGADYEIDFGNPSTWAKMDRLDDEHVRTIYIQPGHYLCLGDNSPESSDGRSWGCVPERLLLGRALLVYYPLGRAGKIR